MILDWHSHIYTPEEAADDLRTWDGNTGPSWGERGCPMVLENFVRAHKREQHRHQRRHQRRALPQGQARRRGAAVGAGVVRLRRQGAAGPQGHALQLRHHPAVRRAGLHQGDRARHQAARAQGHLHPFQPQGALSRRRRGAAVLGAGAGPRRAGDDPSAASRLRRGADAGLSPGVQHRPAVRPVSRARAA